MLSLPPRVDLSAVSLTASHNRQLLAQGTFQTSGGGQAAAVVKDDLEQ